MQKETPKFRHDSCAEPASRGDNVFHRRWSGGPHLAQVATGPLPAALPVRVPRLNQTAADVLLRDVIPDDIRVDVRALAAVAYLVRAVAAQGVATVRGVKDSITIDHLHAAAVLALFDGCEREFRASENWWLVSEVRRIIAGLFQLPMKLQMAIARHVGCFI